MIGLYRKALSLQRRAPQRGTPSDVPANTEDGISAEERAKISGDIDAIIASSRIQISPQTLAYTPKRHGAFLPIVSNIVVLTVFALAGFVIFRLLNHQEQYIATGQAAVQGAENQLIAAIKKEAERQLQSRDQTILDAQGKLQSLSQQEKQLQTESESSLKAKEQALTAEYEVKLAQEKERLQKQGLSAAAQSRRLSEFEATHRQEADRQLAAARRQAQADLAARQKSFAVLASQYQNNLDAAREQRAKIQSDLQQRQEDLRAQAQAQQAAQQAALQPTTGQPAAGQPEGGPAASAASEDLARLRAQRENEQLILDQILAGYSRVNAALQSKDYSQAQAGLDALRKLLLDPSVAPLPTIQKRSAVELFLIDSLGDLIASRRYAVSADAASVAEAASQLRSISDLVARGDGLSKAGDLAGARNAYLQALQVIPSVNRGYQGLDSIRLSSERQGSAEAIAGLQQANLFFQAGNFLGSVQRYRSAVGLLLNDQALAGQLTDNIMNAGYRVLAADDLAALARLRTDAQRRQAIVKRLQDLRDQYLAYTALMPPVSPDMAGGQSLASLLQAKILLRQILDSDPIRSKYPDLSGQIERYFTALEQQGKTEGRKAAMDELASALGEKPLAGLETQDPLAALLDRLGALLSDR